MLFAAWITKRIEEGLIRGPEDITLPHHFRCSAMGYKAFFTMAYFPLRHFNKPYRCSQAVLMSATTMTLDQLGENGRGVGGCAIAIPHFCRICPQGSSTRCRQPIRMASAYFRLAMILFRLTRLCKKRQGLGAISCCARSTSRRGKFSCRKKASSS
eukprot:5734626-Prymnesium_polylepis.1